MSWTDERVEALKVMWTEGKSASQIAKELGGVTRNAVIGKVHRLGLSNRGGNGERLEETEVAEAPAAAPEPTPAPVVAAPAPVEPEIPAEPIEAAVSPDPRLPRDLPPVGFSPVTLRQVLNSVIANALEAMTEEGRLRISALRQRRRVVVVEVADTGPGMTAAEVEAIQAQAEQEHKGHLAD